jgi:hypothetical protein
MALGYVTTGVDMTGFDRLSDKEKRKERRKLRKERDGRKKDNERQYTDTNRRHDR